MSIVGIDNHLQEPKRPKHYFTTTSESLISVAFIMLLYICTKAKDQVPTTEFSIAEESNRVVYFA